VLLIDCQNQTVAEQEGFELLDQQGVDGVIWFPIDSSVPDVLKKVNFPVVLIDRSLPGFDTVHCDYSRGGALQAEYVIGLGHKRVGLFSGPKKIESARKRRRGFVTAAKNNLDIIWDIDIPFSSELPEKAISLLKKNNVTMVVCADDLIAIGTISVLNELGIEVPTDISVVGFDNISWSTLVTPKLTTINQPIGAIGSEAVNLLQHKIRSIKDGTKEASRTIILDVEMIERASTVRRSKNVR
jgi:LacI family transcriptional regulator